MFQRDDEVEVNGNLGRITGKQRGDYWEINFGRKVEYHESNNIQKVKRNLRLWDAFVNKQPIFEGIEDFRCCLYPYRLSRGLTNLMYSMGNAATKFYPHQFIPVIKFLESHTNSLLIADEVGLGKTIEAMYIWEELRVRKGAKRLLIVCPARLRDKWERDVKQYFKTKIEILGNLNQSLTSLIDEAERHPNEKMFCSIVSLEGVRGAQTVQERLESLITRSRKVFDLVVIDEAHYLRNSETKNFKTAVKLRDTTENLLLLSATPIQTNSDNLFNLLSLLSPYEFYNNDAFKGMLYYNRPVVRLANELERVNNYDRKGILDCLKEIRRSQYYADDSLFKYIESNLEEILGDRRKLIQTIGNVKRRFFYNTLISRNRKRDVFENCAVRNVETVHFNLSEYEMEFYETVSDYLRDEFNPNNFSNTFRLIARQRQMASSLPAALMSWRENTVTQGDHDEAESATLSQYALTASSGELKQKRAIEANPMPHFDFDIKRLEKEDSKFKAICKNIKNILRNSPNEKIVLFSFFRKTIAYLNRRFNDEGIRCVSIMGGGNANETGEVINKFRHGDYNILLTTEVCSEGVDLQFARYEINYDVPWNPMRLEQRIGRIDRIGQESNQIYIHNAICTNTIEDRILERLHQRISLFRDTLGDLEEILGSEIDALQLSVFTLDRNMSQEAIDRQVEISMQAIEKKRNMTESLESQVGIMASQYQQFVLDNIKLSYQNKRHIDSSELVFMIRNVLEKFYHGSFIQVDKTNCSIVLISLSNDARTDFTKYQRVNLPFAHSALLDTQGAVQCSLGKNQNVHHEVIDINHPLVQWLLSKIESKYQEQTIGCNLLRLVRKEVDSFPKIRPGEYVYIIQHWCSTGVQQQRELCFHMMHVEDDEEISSLDAEQAIILTMLHGDSFCLNDLSNDMYYAAGYALERLSHLIDMASAQRKKEQDGQNHALGEVQRRYLKGSYEQKRAKIEEIILKHQWLKNVGLERAERKRLEEETRLYEMRLGELERKFKVVSSFTEVTLGILFVE